MSLDQLVTESVSSILKSDDLKTYVDNAVAKAVQDSVQSAISYSSDFRKQLQQKVEECLPIVSVDDLAVFSNAVREVIKHRLVNLANETAAEHVGGLIDDLIPDSREVLFEHLIESFKNYRRDQEEREDHCHCDGDDYSPEFGIEVSHSGSSDRYWYLVLKPSEDESKWSSQCIHIDMREIEGRPNCHKVYHVGGAEVYEKTMFAGPLYGFSALIFRLATQTSVLVADREAVVRRYGI